MFENDLLQLKLEKLSHLSQDFQKSSNHRILYKWQCKRKCSVVSNSVQHVHIGLIVSLKPYLNLCSLRYGVYHRVDHKYDIMSPLFSCLK